MQGGFFLFGSAEASGLREASVLATNTSSISITKLASGVSRPERVIGSLAALAGLAGLVDELSHGKTGVEKSGPCCKTETFFRDVLQIVMAKVCTSCRDLIVSEAILPGCGVFDLRNPVPVMPLVEVIRGLRTDDATLQLTLQLCTAMKKEHCDQVLFMPCFCRLGLN